MQDLNNLIDRTLGWTLTDATGINESGQIVGYGTIASGGPIHAFLLTPIPEPSTLVLLGIGAMSLLAYAWRRRRAPFYCHHDGSKTLAVRRIL